MAADWTLIHAERASLAQDLGTLDEEQWSTPSLCDAWTVHQALGHLVSTAKRRPDGSSPSSRPPG